MKELSEADVAAKVAEIRQRVRVPPDYDVGRQLERWVRGWEGDVDEIARRLPATLEFRRAMELDKVPNEAFEAWAKGRFNPLALDYYPGGFSGLDREGNAVLIEPLGLADPKGLMPCGRCSEFYRSRLAETEYLARRVREAEARSGRRQALLYVMDLEGLTMDKLGLPNMHIYMDLIRMLQEHWPELLHRILIIKAPTILHVAYNMVAPILARQTREKLEIVGKEWQGRLFRLVDPSQLPRHWGGEQSGPDGSPYGGIRMGGDVPRHLRYKPEANPYEPAQAGQPLTKLSLGRNSVKEVDLVLAAPSRVSWFFSVPSGDIYFAIRDKASGRPIFPRMRLNTEHVPEWGSLITPPATLIFLFDNSHSTFKSKSLQYYLRPEPLSDGETAPEFPAFQHSI